MKDLFVAGARRFAKPVLMFVAAVVIAVLLRQCDIDVVPALLVIEGMWK